MPYENRPIQCTAFYCWGSIDRLSEAECRTGIRALAGLMGVLARTTALALGAELIRLPISGPCQSPAIEWREPSEGGP